MDATMPATMPATMHACSPAEPPELSATQRYALLAVAVVAALLGLTTLDVEGPATHTTSSSGSERTTECIVASALFAGVAPARAP